MAFCLYSIKSTYVEEIKTFMSEFSRKILYVKQYYTGKRKSSPHGGPVTDGEKIMMNHD